MSNKVSGDIRKIKAEKGMFQGCLSKKEVGLPLNTSVKIEPGENSILHRNFRKNC